MLSGFHNKQTSDQESHVLINFWTWHNSFKDGFEKVGIIGIAFVNLSAAYDMGQLQN